MAGMSGVGGGGGQGLGALSGYIGGAAKGATSAGLSLRESRIALEELQKHPISGPSGAETAAGAAVMRALAGKAVSDADIAPQVTAVREQTAMTQRGLMEAISSSLGGQNTSTRSIRALTGQTAQAQAQNLRSVFAEQAAANLQARQQAAQTAVGLGQLGLQREKLREDRRRTEAALRGKKEASRLGIGLSFISALGNMGSGGGGQ